MKATFAQKIIIQLLCDIHKASDINGELDADFISKAIMFNSWAIDWRYGSLNSDEDVQADDPIVSEVADILDMFRAMNHGFDKLDTAAKEKLSAAGVEKQSLVFEGFDANNDRHYGVAKFMIDDLGRFSEHQGKDINSHATYSLAEYRAMLLVYKRIKKDSFLHGLPDADGILKLIEAKNNRS